jgi:hypothetical protein
MDAMKRCSAAAMTTVPAPAAAATPADHFRRVIGNVNHDAALGELTAALLRLIPPELPEHPRPSPVPVAARDLKRRRC